MKLRKRIKRAAVFRFTRFLFWLLNVVRRPCAIFIGGMLGLAAWGLLTRERYKAFRHLGLVFGDDLTVSERNNIGRAFFINSGKNIVDAVRFRKHYAAELKPLVDVEGLEHFDAAYNKGKGLFGVTGHIGNFELIAVHIRNLGYEVAVIGREMYDPRLDQLLVENRQAMGLTNISTTDSPRELLSWLKKGGAVGVLIDNDSPRVRSIHIPAFGRLANTPIGQAVIARKTGSALVPIVCLRNENNGYKIVIKPEISVATGLSDEEWIYQTTMLCTKELESIIRANPTQWPWHHNRWRTKPENTA